MKRSKILLSIISLGLIAGCAFGFSKSVSSLKATNGTILSINDESYWKTLSGAAVTKNTSSGVEISNLYAALPHVTFKNAINLDGFEFDFSRKTDLSTNGAVSFFFSNQCNTARKSNEYGGSPVITFSRNPYTNSQTRVMIGASHNIEAAVGLNSYDKVNSGFGSTGISAGKQTMVCNMTAATTNFEGMRIRFEKGTGDELGWWIVTFKELTTGYIKNSATAKNYVKDELTGLASIKTYISEEHINKILYEGTTYTHLNVCVNGPTQDKAKTVYIENATTNDSFENEFANNYLDSMVCDPTGSAFPSVDQDKWDALVSSYNDLGVGLKNNLKARVMLASDSNTLLDFEERYRLIATKYPSLDFMDIASDLASTRVINFIDTNLFILSFIAASSIAIFFLFLSYKKKKSQQIVTK